MDFPALNACLNGTSAVLLATGYAMIRKKRVEAHKRCMLGAVGVSVLFLISYLIYHFEHGATRFPGNGAAAAVYFTILISHTVLAVSLVVLVPITLRRALRGDLPAHRKIARWTFPIWLYVSVTGVVVYWMLYQVSW